MSEFMIDDAGSELATPVEDKNIQTPAAQATGTANPPIPADHAQQTPEFLSSLIRELNTLRQESSDLFAKMYPPHSPLTHEAPHRPPYEELAEYKRLDAELDGKIGALKAQIDDLRVLIAKKVQPAPETNKVVGPSGPLTPEPAEATSGK